MKKNVLRCLQGIQAGFSLIEVLITLVIIGIVAAISAPAILTMAPDMALKSAARDIYGTLQQAKILAIKENRDVTVRFDSAGYYYFDDNANSTWDAGETRIMLGEDLNNNGIEDPGEDVNGDGIWDKNYGITVGTGTSAANDWNGAAFVALNAVTFNSRGLTTLDPVAPPPLSPSLPSVYLQNKNKEICYSVEAHAAGSLKLRRFNGSTWIN